jgi:hypothetical protein
VVSVDPSVFTPRNVMQLCSASITPCGSRMSWMASAISAVSFSWICSRRAKRAPSLLRQLPLAECCVVSRPCGGMPWLARCRLVPMPLRLRFHFPMLQNLRANCLRLTPRWTLRFASTVSLVESLPKISAEVARVTSGHFIITVRSVGSTPTIFVDSIEKARHFKHDNSRDQCEVELCDGRL